MKSLPKAEENLFTFSGLADFLGFHDLACGLASTPQRLVELSYGLGQRLADNGTGYADAIFTPTHWHAWRRRLGAMLDAMDAGFKEAEQGGLPMKRSNWSMPCATCAIQGPLKMRVYPSIQEHPIEQLRAAGVRVSVNTDDPALLGGSLVGEYGLCRQTFGWTDEITKAVARTSIEASFANANIKANLMQALNAW